MAKKKSEDKATYICLIGFSAKGKIAKEGEPCPEFDAETTRQLLAMKRMAPEGSDEANALIERLTARNKRAEADKKAAEKAGRLPGA